MYELYDGLYYAADTLNLTMKINTRTIRERAISNDNVLGIVRNGRLDGERHAHSHDTRSYLTLCVSKSIMKATI